MKTSICVEKFYKAQSGLSLIELLVSLVIGMAVLAGSIQVVVNSKQDFLGQGEIQFIQTNSRYALDLISKDVRSAGYFGCTTLDSVNISNSIADDENGFISIGGLQGFEGSTSTAGFPDDYKSVATAGTDSFIVRRASLDREIGVKSHNPTTQEMTLWDDHGFTAAGSTLVIADASCRSLGLFQVSSLDTKKIRHGHGDDPLDGNCTSVIKGSFSCASASCGLESCNKYDRNTGGYSNGATVREFVSHAYYIGPSAIAPGVSALKRQVLDTTGVAATSTEEVALGVEDFEVTYGVDSNADGNVDRFLSADAMDLNSSGTISNDEWGRVLSLKLALVFRSQNPVLPTQQAKTLLGVAYNDRFSRQLVNTTIRIRNRG